MTDSQHQKLVPSDGTPAASIKDLVRALARASSRQVLFETNYQLETGDTKSSLSTQKEQPGDQ